ncbi:MAG: hypothetical protein PHS44_03070 [Candidatus Dojkabacteria bacterium]|nr:hypothetical protein [Candidatus Dojkabacteria bacterium]
MSLSQLRISKKRSYTKSADDWNIIYKKGFKNKVGALNFERYLKNQERNNVLLGLSKYDPR